MEYLTLDCHSTRVYGHHFVIMNHFRHGVKMSFLFYLMSILRANFNDHKKNPSKFPILHEGLLVLIDSHFHALPAPNDYIHTSSSEDTSVGESGEDESGSDSKGESHPPPKKVKLEKSMNTNPPGGKGKKGQKKIVVSSSSTSAGNDSLASSGTKASP